MVKEYVEQINKLLNKIQEENDENIEEIINYETSTEVCIGSVLCRYGEIWKVVQNANTYDEIICELEKFKYMDRFDCYMDEINEVQEQAYEFIRENYSFEMGKINIRANIEYKILYQTIMEKL